MLKSVARECVGHSGVPFCVSPCGLRPSGLVVVEVESYLEFKGARRRGKRKMAPLAPLSTVTSLSR
jgi:hypothetical protein